MLSVGMMIAVEETRRKRGIDEKGMKTEGNIRFEWRKLVLIITPFEAELRFLNLCRNHGIGQLCRRGAPQAWNPDVLKVRCSFLW